MRIVRRESKNGMIRSPEDLSSEIVSVCLVFVCFSNEFFCADIDTDELDSDTKNVEEEIVEFFIKEEVTVID